MLSPLCLYFYQPICGQSPLSKSTLIALAGRPWKLNLSCMVLDFLLWLIIFVRSRLHVVHTPAGSVCSRAFFPPLFRHQYSNSSKLTSPFPSRSIACLKTRGVKRREKCRSRVGMKLDKRAIRLLTSPSQRLFHPFSFRGLCRVPAILPYPKNQSHPRPPWRTTHKENRNTVCHSSINSKAIHNDCTSNLHTS